jgi:probable F420-dependent oxidoreductase
VRLGVNILNFGPDAEPALLRGWARFAEQAGFAIGMISDHVALTPDVAAMYPAPFYDPFATLAWLAGQTESIELGTSVVILPYRSPLLVARMAAAIDQFSGGRFVLGVGVGWSEREFAAVGVPYAERGERTSEHLAAILRLWTADVASLEGRFTSFTDVHTGPRPARRPHPPVWIGGSSAAGIARAARFADAWHPIDPRVGWLRDRGLPMLREAAAAEGRPPPALCPRINLDIGGTAAGDGDDRRTGVGTLAQVLGDLDALAELGADYVVLDTYQGRPDQRRPAREDWRMLETIAERYAAG